MAVYNVLQSAELYRLKHSIRQMLSKFKDTLSKVSVKVKEKVNNYDKNLLFKLAQPGKCIFSDVRCRQNKLFTAN